MLLASNFLCFVELIKSLKKKSNFLSFIPNEAKQECSNCSFFAKGRKYKCDVLAAINCI